MMKHMHGWMRTLLLVLCLLAVLSLGACTADMDIGNNTALGEQFITHLIRDDYDAAYALLKNTVTSTEFGNYWEKIQPLAEGAETYEMEQIGWKINRSNGQTTRTTAYQVYLDNGKTALLRIATVDDIAGIAGIYMSDITGFIAQTEAFVPGVEVVLLVISLAVSAFTIWMLVDCIRRKIKRKVLWLILIVCGVAFTVTLGETSGLRFAVGLMLQFSAVVADPATLSVTVKCILPVGAIVYLCLRKRLTVLPVAADEAGTANETAVADGEAKATESESAEPVSEENQ